MYAKARRRAEKRPVEDTVRYRPNDIRVIGAHADYRREDFIFPRTQSPQLRELEWEGSSPERVPEKALASHPVPAFHCL